MTFPPLLYPPDKCWGQLPKSPDPCPRPPNPLSRIKPGIVPSQTNRDGGLCGVGVVGADVGGTTIQPQTPATPKHHRTLVVHGDVAACVEEGGGDKREQ
jgi:hypothetical protein